MCRPRVLFWVCKMTVPHLQLKKPTFHATKHNLYKICLFVLVERLREKKKMRAMLIQMVMEFKMISWFNYPKKMMF